MDWRIGRLIRSITTGGNTDANGVINLPAKQDRVGLSVWGTLTGQSVSICPEGVLSSIGVVATNSIILPAHMTLATHGDLPTKLIRLFSLAGGNDVIVYTEYFAPERVLTLGLEQIMKQYPI